MVNIIRKIIAWRQNRINLKNRLINRTPTLICSNCTGGVLYHWLGLKFQSPFINLYMTNNDFISAMENFDKFISTDIIEEYDSGKNYPVGIGYGGCRIHFMHYNTFQEAKQKWDERKQRIDKDNMAIWLTNFNSDNFGRVAECELVKRFNKLPFRNKLIFSGHKIDAPNVIWLKGYNKVEHKYNIFRTQNIFGKRWIDQFDYVSYLNNMLRAKSESY